MIVNFGSGANSAIRDAVLHTASGGTRQVEGWVSQISKYCIAMVRVWTIDRLTLLLKHCDETHTRIVITGTQESQYSIGWCVNTYTVHNLTEYKYKLTHTHTNLHNATSDWCVRALKPDRLGWPMAQVLSRDQRS